MAMHLSGAKNTRYSPDSPLEQTRNSLRVDVELTNPESNFNPSSIEGVTEANSPSCYGLIDRMDKLFECAPAEMYEEAASRREFAED